LLVVLLAVVAAVFIWIAFAYHAFSGDVAKSRARLPDTIRAVLPASADVLDEQQVTLIRYSSGVSTGGALLFATIPDRKLVSFLTIPPYASLPAGQLHRLGVPDLIRGLRRNGVGVDHVAIIDPSDVGQLVDGIGGISVNNPKAFDVQVSPLTTWHFERGPLNLDGPHAVVYLRRGVGSGKVIGEAGLDVLRGIVHRLLQPASVGELQATGTSLARASATDLSDADVVGLVYARLRGGSTLECSVGNVSLTSKRARGTLSAFLGSRAAGGSSGCTVRQIHPQSFLPPKAVVAIVQRYGWEVFAASAAFVLMLMLFGGSAFLLRWRRAARSVNGRLAAPGPRVVPLPEHRIRDRGVAADAPSMSLPIRDPEPTPGAGRLSTPNATAGSTPPSVLPRSDSRLLPALEGLLARARSGRDRILVGVDKVRKRTADGARGAARRWREALSNAVWFIPDAIADRRTPSGGRGAARRWREALSNAVWFIPDAIADRRSRWPHYARFDRAWFGGTADLWTSIQQRGPLVTALVVILAVSSAVLVSALAVVGISLYAF
jgi:hypothetical protein